MKKGKNKGHFKVILVLLLNNNFVKNLIRKEIKSIKDNKSTKGKLKI